MASPRSRKRSATDDGARAPVSKSRKMSAGAQDPIYDIQSLSSPPDNSTDASRLTSLSSISTPASFPSPGLTESARAAAAIRERLRPLLLDNSISLEACRAAMHTEYEKASPEVLRIICPPPAKKYRGAAGIAKLKEEIEKAKETRGVSSQAESIPPGRGHFQPLMRYQAFVSPSPPPTKRPGGEPIKSFEDYPEGTVEPWDDEEVPASMPCPEPDHKWLNGEKRMHIVERMEAAEAAAKEKIVEQVRKEEAPKQKAPKQEKPKEEKEMGRKRKREYVGLNEKGHWAPPAEGSRRIRRQLKEEKDMGRKRKREYVGLNEKGHWAPPAEGSKRIRRQLKRE